MEYKTLELNIISANGLKEVNHYTEMDVYAVVSISDDHQAARTHVHRQGGTNPTWNYPTKFNVNQNCHSLKVTLLSDQDRAVDTMIGSVHIPIKELLDNPSDNSFRRASFQVRTSSGKGKGNLNLSYKFGDKVEAPVIASPLHSNGVATAGSGSVLQSTLPAAAAHGGYRPAQAGYSRAQSGHGYQPQLAAVYGNSLPAAAADGSFPSAQPGYSHAQAGHGHPPQHAAVYGNSLPVAAADGGYLPAQPGYSRAQLGHGYQPQHAAVYGNSAAAHGGYLPAQPGYSHAQPGHGHPPQHAAFNGYSLPAPLADDSFPSAQPSYAYGGHPGNGYPSPAAVAYGRFPPVQSGHGYLQQQPGYGYPGGAQNLNQLATGLQAGLLACQLGENMFRLEDMFSDAPATDDGFGF